MEFKYLVSLGPNCVTAGFIKRLNLKVCSYPFDWIYSSPSIIKDCLENNFKIFLNKSNIINIKGEKNKCGHKLYDKKMFQHHNLVTSKDDYRYFERCINRFNNVLLSDEQKLFFMFYKNFNLYNVNSVKNEILSFNKKLNKCTSNYKLCIFLQVINSKKKHSYEKYFEHKKIVIYIVYTENKYLAWGKPLNENDKHYVNSVFNSLFTFDLVKYY